MLQRQPYSHCVYGFGSTRAAGMQYISVGGVVVQARTFWPKRTPRWNDWRPIERQRESVGRKPGQEIARRRLRRPHASSIDFRPGQSFPAPLAKMAGQSVYQFFRSDVEGLADSKQCEQRNRSASLDHLPMTDTEPIQNHVLLGQIPLHPVGPNAVPQRTEEPCVVRRDLSAGTHTSSLGSHEQEHHEQN